MIQIKMKEIRKRNIEITVMKFITDYDDQSFIISDIERKLFKTARFKLGGKIDINGNKRNILQINRLVFVNDINKKDEFEIIYN
jgi:hypothetical protein